MKPIFDKSRASWGTVIQDYFGLRTVSGLSIGKPTPRNANIRGFDIQKTAESFLQGKGQ